MHIRGNSTSGFKQLKTAVKTTGLNIVSLLFKSISLVNLKLKSRNRQEYPEAFIISIDNLSFGGTGKTPLILAIGAFLESRNIQFAVVTRGYKSKLERAPRSTKINEHHKVEDTGDEAQLFIRYFPQRDIYVGQNRQDSIQQAIRNNNKIILMDDGFQSTDIKKDLSIMLVNPSQPYYYLRNFKWLARKEDIFLFLAPSGNQVYVPDGWRSVSAGSRQGNYGFHLDSFHLPTGEPIGISRARLAGFSALGDNERFKRDLQAYNLVDFKSYSDHFFFDDGELEQLKQWLIQLKADYLVCTEKDFVKCKMHKRSEIPLIYAKNSIEFTFDLMNVILNHANKSNNI